MTRTERLTERAITFAIAEADEDLAVARLAFLARTERTLFTRWRAISFLVRVRYEDQPTREQPATSRAGRFNGRQGSAPGGSRGRGDDSSG